VDESRRLLFVVLADERTAAALTHLTPPRNTVFVGPSKGTLFLMTMAPSVLHIHVGDTVTFKIPRGTSETHAASFGPARCLSGIEKNLITPVGSPAGPPTLQFNPVAFYPSDPPPGLPPYNGRNHGNSFENSGAMDSNSHTPFPSEVRIKFTKAETFRDDCLIHPEMDGTIVV
jgi:plastocyanin